LLAEKALHSDPEAIFKPIEALMAQSLPHGQLNPDGSASARVWLEHRSLVSDHRGTVNLAWLVAGARDCLIDNPPRVLEARARLGLLLSCIEQVSIDAGSWQMGWEMALESQPPPYAAFGHRRVAAPSGVAETFAGSFSPILDPRLRELHMSRLKYADEAMERRKRMTERNRTRWWDRRPPQQPAAAADDKGRGKGGRGKGDQKGKDD